MSRRTTRYDVNERTIFITGAARGIGAETARRLHGKGANVALVGLEPGRLEQLAAQLGDRSIAIEADVTDYAALQRAASATVERFGAIDVGIANAGVAFTGSLASAPIEQVERTLAVNFLGVWRTDRALIAQIVKRKGYLLNISSLSAIAHAPLMGPYTSTKAGVEALTDALRMETAPTGARIGCAYFGFINTDMVRGSFAQPSTQALNKRLPSFMRNPAPLSQAIDAIEQGIERRSSRLWAPRWIGAMLALRGIVQPLTERQTLGEPDLMTEAIHLAASSHETDTQDPLLGVAMQAVDPAL